MPFDTAPTMTRAEKMAASWARLSPEERSARTLKGRLAAASEAANCARSVTQRINHARKVAS